jgi:capsular polysaccharide biosynthesis protein
MQETVAASAVHDLGHYTRPLRRHKAIIAVCIILGVALGGFGSTRLHATYTSSARVLVLTDITDQGAGNTATGRTAGTVNLDTEAQLVKSEKMAATVQQMLKTAATPENLASRLTVTVPANTPVLDLTFSAGTAAAAQAGATAFANAYLANRATVAKDYLALETTSLTKAINTATAKLQKVTNTAASAPSTSARDFAKQQENTLQADITSLNLQLNAVTTAPVVPGRVISPASTGVRSKLKREVVIVSGALLGILIGLIAAFGRDRTRPTVRNRDDLEDLGLRTVGENKRSSRATRRHGVEPGGGAEHQAATALASAVGPRGVFYVAGVTSAGAAARVGGRIAKELRRFGATVQVIQVEPASGGAHELAPTNLSRTSVGEPPTWFVTLAGLHAAGLRGQIATNQDRVDYVLIVGGDAERSSEAYLVASTADATVLVAETGVTTRKGLRAVADEIRLTSSNLIGAVLVRPERDGAPADGGISSPENLSPEARTSNVLPHGQKAPESYAGVLERPPAHKE